MTRSIALPRACRTLALFAAMPVAACVAFAQAPPTAPANTNSPTFAVSVVKPSGAGSVRSIKFSPGGRLTVRSATVRLLMKIADDLNDDELTGGPAWIGLKRFDIDATRRTGQRRGRSDSQSATPARLVSGSFST